MPLSEFKQVLAIIISIKTGMSCPKAYDEVLRLTEGTDSELEIVKRMSGYYRFMFYHDNQSDFVIGTAETVMILSRTSEGTYHYGLAGVDEFQQLHDTTNVHFC
jgi:hypothetical protein